MVIREFNPETDTAFVLKTYLDSLKHVGINYWRSWKEYKTNTRPAALKLLETSITLVDEVEGELRGYAQGYYDYAQETLCGKPVFVIHFIYTKGKYRRQKVSKTLTDQLTSKVLLQTPNCIFITTALSPTALAFAQKEGYKTLGTTLAKDVK